MFRHYIHPAPFVLYSSAKSYRRRIRTFFDLFSWCQWTVNAPRRHIYGAFVTIMALHGTYGAGLHLDDVSFSYLDALLLGDGSRTTSPRSDVHPHSASQLTHLTKGNAIIHKNTKKSKQALPMDKISTKASASDDSSNPKVCIKICSCSFTQTYLLNCH